MHTTFRVAIVNSIENTGLDCAVFGSRDEAEMAAEMVREWFDCSENSCDVIATIAPATTTFERWCEANW